MKSKAEVVKMRLLWEGDDVVLLGRRITDGQETAPALVGAVDEDEAIAGGDQGESMVGELEEEEGGIG